MTEEPEPAPDVDRTLAEIFAETAPVTMDPATAVSTYREVARALRTGVLDTAQAADLLDGVADAIADVVRERAADHLHRNPPKLNQEEA